MFVLIVGDHASAFAEARETIAGYGMDWQLELVRDAAAAEAVAGARAIDVAAVDLCSPGIDGPALLAGIRGKHPEVVRILLLDANQQDTPMRLLDAAHRVLSKPLRADELIEAVESVDELREVLDSEQLKGFIGGIAELPAAPSLYLKLTQTLNDPNAPANAAANLVSQDPAIASKVLRLCNSAYFSGGRTVSDIRSAVIRLGQENLRRLVLASEVFAGQSPLSEGEREAMQQNALRASQIAARLLGDASAELAATATLLADVGLLLPGVSRDGSNGSPHYAQAGAYLLGLWGLPMPIVEAVAHHHQPGKARNRGFWVGGAVHVAHALARGEPIDEDYLHRVGLLDRLEAWRKIASDIAAKAG